MEVSQVVVRHAVGGVTKVLRVLSNNGAAEWCAMPSNGGRG